MRRTVVSTAIAYVAALATTYVLATIAATQAVLARVSDMGLTVGIKEHLGTTGHDLMGMLSSFLPLIALALLIAFGCAGLLSRWWPGARLALFVLAGAAALWALHSALNIAFDITPVAAARTPAGLAVQLLVGGAGGAVFAMVKKVPAQK